MDTIKPKIFKRIGSKELYVYSFTHEHTKTEVYFSYDTPILIIVTNTWTEGKRFYLNKIKYSQTTTKHFNYLIKTFKIYEREHPYSIYKETVTFRRFLTLNHIPFKNGVNYGKFE